ncbi:hypothetical protein ACIBL3_29545 [Kribbella sp. NPDC050124]|uniref:hypothetical protein n=1 Tax=Kribbella sp. NPDC050124 TaxID=3364114 RepID=UPI00379DA0B4
MVLERRLGGRIYERTQAGDEIDWGEITAWDPPEDPWILKTPPGAAEYTMYRDSPG